MNLRRAVLHAVLMCLLTSGASLACIFPGRSGGTHGRQVDPDLTTHEWGTFTSIAGNDGRAVEWSPLEGWPSTPGAATVNDLPAFIEHFRFQGFKLGLIGMVRMETPVIYFYSPRNVDVSVHVALSRGLITEWYPHASRVTPAPASASTYINKDTGDGTISWDLVHVEPGLVPNFARESTDNHYYAARETSASPVRVQNAKGDQQEKFLFYRGVSAFSVPVSAKVMADGNVLVSNLGGEQIPGLVLFERRGERLGYRISAGLEMQVQLEPPELNGNINSLYGEIEQMLVAQGLYWDEAHAMVQTWQNSWFEEGSRLFYLVPESFVDSVLPLTINPVPARTVRVFVGRMELVTPATQKAVETAVASKDEDTLKKYGRFLWAIRNVIEQRNLPKAKQFTNPAGATCDGQAAQQH